ncbi:ribosomal L1 domain-containing protein 1 [Lampris incognitus]|uniref:ribosomal L1 domain-containing protein 1 n=1 Tax=Lampris incognitus TaxID=2546036 RepID=UPI0024B4AD04|nr:ribosomal L1 domain-containing protein 1 [Lampris incognitus]
MRTIGQHVKAVGMAQKTEEKELELDRAQVKKAVQALQAFLKSKSTPDSLFLNEAQQICLLFTLWKIPKEAQRIRIPLPHGQWPDANEVCLFTKDEPNMSPEQTQRFYKKLLEEKGVQRISEIIPYKMLKTEYKPYEAKRRLLRNFDFFLSDDRIRRLLPSHLGKHFYERKREPLCVNLMSKTLARDVESIVQGTSLKVSNRGCCCMARIAHSGMTTDEVTENIETAVKTVVAKLRMNGPVMKLIHLKSQSSAALPIYTSDLSHLTMLEDARRQAKAAREEKAAAKKQAKKDKEPNTTSDTKTDAAAGEKRKSKEEEDDDDEIPQLVPIVTPAKRPKQEKPSEKKKLGKTGKLVKIKSVQNRRNQAGRKGVPQKSKRKMSKSK